MLVEPLLRKQLRMRTDFHDLTVLHDNNSVGIDNRRQSMCHHESRSAFEKRIKRRLNMALAFRIKRTRRFVK